MRRTCGMPKCDGIVEGLGLCSKHYHQRRRGHNIPTFKIPKGNLQEDIEIQQPSLQELGWLCGLLEGEGYFSYDNTQRIILKMVDEDVVRKYKDLLEKILKCDGEIPLAMDNYVSKDQPVYRITINGARARAIMHLVVHHMGDRRRIKIWQCINRYKANNKIDLATLVIGMKHANN